MDVETEGLLLADGETETLLLADTDRDVVLEGEAEFEGDKVPEADDVTEDVGERLWELESVNDAEGVRVSLGPETETDEMDGD